LGHFTAEHSLDDRLRVLRALRSEIKKSSVREPRQGRAGCRCCLPALAGFASLPSMAPDGARTKARGGRADKMKTWESLRKALAKNFTSRLKTPRHDVLALHQGVAIVTSPSDPPNHTLNYGENFFRTDARRSAGRGVLRIPKQGSRGKTQNCGRPRAYGSRG